MLIEDALDLGHRERRARRGERGVADDHQADDPLLAHRQRGARVTGRRGRGRRGIAPERHAHRDRDRRRDRRLLRGAEERELDRDLPGVARSAAGILAEHPAEELSQRVGHVGPELLRARRVVEEDLRQDGQRVRPLERRPARQALEEHAAEREHVDARVDVALAADLLRGDVARGAEHRPCPRQPTHVAVGPGDPEVDDLDAPHVPSATSRLSGLRSR